MRWLRSTWLSRVLVAVLAVGMLSMMGLHLPDGPQTSAKARWLQAQVVSTLDADAQRIVDRALSEADAQNARTLQAYTQAFAEAYEAASADLSPASPAPDLPSLGALFDAPDVDAAALYAHLQGKTVLGGPPAVLPRLHAASVTSLTAPPRSLAAVSSPSRVPSALVRTAPSLQQAAPSVFACCLRLLWSAQPLGP